MIQKIKQKLLSLFKDTKVITLDELKEMIKQKKFVDQFEKY